MYNDIDKELTQRISEIREHLDSFAGDIPSPPTSVPRYLNTQKGLIFVELYGVIEFMMTQLVSRTALVISNENLPINDLSPHLWSMVLDSKLETLQAANRKKWDHRHLLFKDIVDDIPGIVRDDLMPTNGMNFTGKQIESVWKVFNIQSPVFDDPSFGFRLKDIVMNRIEIAHGNKPASVIGSSFTAADLYKRLNDVSAYCSYAVSVFEDYITKKDYLAV